MPATQINLIAIEIRKWDMEAQKITLLSYYLLKGEEGNNTFDVSVLQPPEMVEEFLGKLRFESEKKLREELKDDEIQIEFDNETFLRQKTYNYFKRVTSELSSPRRKKGQPKMIFTTHMDVYNENQDITFLPARFQFFVVLNWARKYYAKEDYKKAIEPLRKLTKVDPNYGPGYKLLARSLKKIRKYDEAMRYYEKYAEVDNSLDAWLDLAKSYRKGKIFDKSEGIYKKILKENKGNKEARIGIAQIKYATKDKTYLKIFDELHKEDAGWLKEWLVEEFNFRIYLSEKTLLSPDQAAKFLGFDQIFELTERAFKNDVPSHFNPSKARLSFYKEELENWAMVMNRFKCLKKEITLFPDRIDTASGANTASNNSGDGTKKGKGVSAKNKITPLEEMLQQIRARKAQKLVEQKGKQPSPARGKSDNGAKVQDKKQGKKSKSSAPTK